MPTIATIAQLFFSFRGRAGRAPFWLVWLFWVVLTQVIDYVWDIGNVPAKLASGNQPVLGLITLALLTSCLAVCVRRLHDRDKSAWWVVPYGIVPPALELLAVASAVYAGPTIELYSIRTIALLVASVVLWLWALIDLGFMPGTAGPNRYGPAPGAPAAVVGEVFD
jgi:uncharacterized membrane protein YhaH (DUF805 family)